MTTEIIPEVKTKVCAKCGHTMSVSEFYSDTRTTDGLSRVCRNCKTEEKVEARRKHIERCKDNPLANFKPRELIEELRARGYKGKLTYTHTIDL